MNFQLQFQLQFLAILLVALGALVATAALVATLYVSPSRRARRVVQLSIVAGLALISSGIAVALYYLPR